MRQTQVLVTLFLLGEIVDAQNAAQGLLQLHRVMQLEPQIKKAIQKDVTMDDKMRRQVQGDPQEVVVASPTSNNHLVNQPYVSNQNLGTALNLIFGQRLQTLAPTHASQVAQLQAPTTYPTANAYYVQPTQVIPIQTYQIQQPHIQQPPQQQEGQQQYVQYVQYLPYYNERVPVEDENYLQAKQLAQYEAIQQKYLQQLLLSQANNIISKFQDNGGQNEKPIQYQINNLAEPVKMYNPAENGRYGQQPKMPVYHYYPLPKGTFQTNLPPVEDMRIKGEPTTEIPQTTTELPQTTTELPQTEPSKEMYKEETYTDTNSYEHNDESHGYEQEDETTYDFGYRVTDSEKGVEMGKMETKVNGVTKGSYHVLLPDGRLQVVKYWSDQSGYHTDISYRNTL